MLAQTFRKCMSLKTARLSRELLLEKYRTINDLVKLLPEHLVFYRHSCHSIFSKKLATLEAMLLEPDDKKIAAVLGSDEPVHTDTTLNNYLEGALREAEEEIKLIESMIERH